MATFAGGAIPSSKTKKKKQKGNDSLKNWQFLPSGLKLFYDEIPLKSIVFRETKSGVKIQVKRKDTSTSWKSYDGTLRTNYHASDWLFSFNTDLKKFGLKSTIEGLWIFSENNDAVME